MTKNSKKSRAKRLIIAIGSDSDSRMRWGLFDCLALVFLQLFLQRINACVDRLLKGLALFTGVEVVAAQNKADVSNLVFRRVGVVKFEVDFGVDDVGVLGTQLLNFCVMKSSSFLSALKCTELIMTFIVNSFLLITLSGGLVYGFA